MMAETTLHQANEPQTGESHTAVLLVHGIGVQPENGTLECYGGAIERLWTNFKNSTGEYTARSNDTGKDRVIKLHGPNRVVTIGEGHWDPVVTHAPSTLRLAYWILVVAPASLIFSCRFPTRGGGQTWRRWINRCALVVPTLALLAPLLVILAALTSVARVLRLVSEDSVDLVARSVGDAFHFTSRSPESTEMIDTVVERARALSAGQNRLIVVAHSQGGAVVWRALRSDRWPSIPTEVITLGSGHLRLLTLRSFRRPGLSRTALGLWNTMALFVSAFMAATLVVAAASLVASDGYTTSGVLAYLTFWGTMIGITIVVLLGVPMLLAQRAVTKAISHTIAGSTPYWLDISSSHDVVPDGAVASKRAAMLTVINRRSLIRDHTTYHENAPGVIAAIVDRIAPERLAQHHELIQQMRSERRELSRFKWRGRGDVRRLRCEHAIQAQFDGIPLSAFTERAPAERSRATVRGSHPPPPSSTWALGS